VKRIQLTKPWYSLENACEILTDLTGEKYYTYDLSKLGVKTQSQKIKTSNLLGDICRMAGIDSQYYILREDLQDTVDKLYQTKSINVLLGLKEYPNLPKELAIANQVYLDIYVNKEPPTGSHKKHIENYIREHYKNLSEKAIERIATMINPNPKGGIGKQT
jgi:hypothetical protein